MSRGLKFLTRGFLSMMALAACSSSDSSGGKVTASGSCPDQVKAATPSTPDSCAACLCDQCPNELMAVGADGKLASDIIDCAVKNNCDGACCFCNSGHTCSTMCTDYALGACAQEIAAGAGFGHQTPGPDPTSCATDGTAIGDACKQSGNACGDATLLGDCERTKCHAQCPQQAPACPM